MKISFKKLIIFSLRTSIKTIPKILNHVAKGKNQKHLMNQKMSPKKDMISRNIRD